MHLINFLKGTWGIILLILISGCIEEPEKTILNEDRTPDESTVMSEPEPVSEKVMFDDEVQPETNLPPIESVAKPIIFSWQKDSGSRIVDGSVPFIHREL